MRGSAAAISCVAVAVVCVGCSSPDRQSEIRAEEKTAPDPPTWHQRPCDPEGPEVRDTTLAVAEAGERIRVQVAFVASGRRARPCFIRNAAGAVARITLSHHAGAVPDAERTDGEVLRVMSALASVRGVGRVEIASGFQPALLVEMREDDLDRLRLGVAEVMEALGRGTQEHPAGPSTLAVTSAPHERSVLDLGATPIGAARLSDVATISFTRTELRTEPRGPEGTLLAIYKERDALRADVLAALKDRTEQLTKYAGELERGGGPAGVRVELLP